MLIIPPEHGQSEVAQWERLHIDWTHLQQVGNAHIIVDAGSQWIDAFVFGDRQLKLLQSVFRQCLRDTEKTILNGF